MLVHFFLPVPPDLVLQAYTKMPGGGGLHGWLWVTDHGGLLSESLRHHRLHGRRSRLAGRSRPADEFWAGKGGVPWPQEVGRQLWKRHSPPRRALIPEEWLSNRELRQAIDHKAGKGQGPRSEPD